MQRRRFEQLVEEALAGLPPRFREKLQNVVVMVEDLPRRSRKARAGPRPRGQLVLGVFQGVPRTEKSVFDTAAPAFGPDRIVLYQKNIEAVSSTDDEVREQVRLTVLHELGHYFGLSEEELEHL